MELNQIFIDQAAFYLRNLIRIMSLILLLSHYNLSEFSKIIHTCIMAKTLWKKNLS